MGKDLKGRELGKNIGQRKDGRYIGRYTDYYGRRQTIYDNNLKELKIKLNKAMFNKDLNNGTANIKNLNFHDMFLIWFDYKRDILKESTLANYENVYYRHIKPSIGDIRLTNIDKKLLRRLFGKLQQQDVSKKYLEIMKNIINNVFKYSIELEYLTYNPCEKLELKLTQREVNQNVKKDRIKFLTQKQTEVLFDYAKKMKKKALPLYQIIVLTGMRIGEAICLRWEDVDFENKIIAVTKTFSHAKSNSIDSYTLTQTPKSKTSARKIPLCEDAVKLLEEQRKSRYTNDEFVFISAKGQPYRTTQNFNIGLKKLIERYNMTEMERSQKENRTPFLLPVISIHALRHTFATMCFKQGIPPKIVQTYLGHSTLSITMDLYTHVTDESLSQDIEKINGLIGLTV